MENDKRKAFHSFKFVGDPSSVNKHIYMDGQELKGVVSATLIWEVDSVPRVFLEMISTDVEADEPLAAVLQYEEEKNADGTGE